MQTAGMLRGTRAIYFLALFIALIGCAYSYPLQILPSIPGFIPVYIRVGDEPLENINPALAEAFHETPSSKSLRLENVSSLPAINVEEEESSAIQKINRQNIYPPHNQGIEVKILKEDEKEEKKTETLISSNDEGPKVLDVSPFHEDDEELDKGEHEHSRRNPPVLLQEFAANLSPISDAEREGLEKLAIQVAKKAINPNDYNNVNLDQSEVQKNRHRVLEGFAEAFKIPKPSNGDIIVDTEHSSNQEPLEKMQYPVNVLSNVQKVSPISPGGGNSEDSKNLSTVSDSIAQKNVPSTDEVSKVKDEGTSEDEVSTKDEQTSADEEPTKIQALPASNSENNSQPSGEYTPSASEEPHGKLDHPENTAGNVFKLSPIPQEEDNSKSSTDQDPSNLPTGEEKKEEEEKEEAMTESAKVATLSTTSTPEDNSESSNKEDASEPKETSSIEKLQNPANNLGNVLKTSPMSSGNDKAESPKEGSSSTEAIAEKEVPSQEQLAMNSRTVPSAQDSQDSKAENGTNESLSGNEEPQVKVLRPMVVASNVFKISAAPSLKEITESTAKTDTKDSSKEVDDIAMN